MLLERIGGPGTVEVIEPDIKYKIFDCIEILIDGKILVIEWQATPVTDMYADTVLASLMQTEIVGNTIKSTGKKPDREYFKGCLVETLQEIYGESSVPKELKGDSLSVTVNGKTADINLLKLVSLHICASIGQASWKHFSNLFLFFNFRMFRVRRTPFWRG